MDERKAIKLMIRLADETVKVRFDDAALALLAPARSTEVAPRYGYTDPE